MGGLCAQQLNEIDKELILKDLEFKNFIGKNDNYFYMEKNNYLSYLNLTELMHFIYSIVPDNDPSNNHLKGEKSFHDEVSLYKLPILFRNKLLKHPIVIQKVSDENQNFRNFVSFYNKSFEFVYLNYKSYFRKIFNEKLREDVDKLPKLVLIPLVFHACGSTPNKLKLNIMFNILSEDGFLKKNSTDLDIFLYFLFVYPTNIALITMDKQAEEDEEIRKNFPSEVFNELFNAYETKDSRVAVEAFIEELFEQDNSLDYQTFEKRMVEKKLYYIFTESGVRWKLEEKFDSEQKENKNKS